MAAKTFTQTNVRSEGRHPSPRTAFTCVSPLFVKPAGVDSLCPPLPLPLHPRFFPLPPLDTLGRLIRSPACCDTRRAEGTKSGLSGQKKTRLAAKSGSASSAPETWLSVMSKVVFGHGWRVQCVFSQGIRLLFEEKVKYLLSFQRSEASSDSSKVCV